MEDFFVNVFYSTENVKTLAVSFYKSSVVTFCKQKKFINRMH